MTIVSLETHYTRARSYYACGGCRRLVLVETLTAHAHFTAGAGWVGNSPLCPVCAELVTCDGCNRALPMGLARFGSDRQTALCAACVETEIIRAEGRR